MAKQPKAETSVETLRYPEDVTRVNIPTAETSGLMQADEADARPRLYPRNPDLDPQLVWRGKDAQDSAPLAVDTVPIYIQEKVKPEALIRDLRRQARGCDPQANLFGGFDRIDDPEMKLDFYQHAENWSNRMILGDSLLVMNSLAEKEGLKGQVQMIYLDPPYGIRFGSNWQPSTRTREVKEGKAEGVSREPEQIAAFRDTWKDGVHSYLSYLRDRLTVARELLTETGSVFVQIGDENVHRVRAVMDEVFGSENFVDQIIFQTSSGRVSDGLDGVYDVVIWYCRDRDQIKIHQLKHDRNEKQLETAYTYLQFEDGTYRFMTTGERDGRQSIPEGARRFRPGQTQSQSGGETSRFTISYHGGTYDPPATGGWRTSPTGFERAGKASRLIGRGKSIAYRLCNEDYPFVQMTNVWTDTVFVSFGSEKTYVVQTNPIVIQRCLLMATNPGDLVLDPTCGSGTTAAVAEQWGRRWITIDTSRVALALARTRLMAARHPPYLLRDSRDGAAKEAAVTGHPPLDGPFHHDIRQGFVLERVPHVTLKSIANNAEIDLIHDKWQPILDTARSELNQALGTRYREWEIPRTLPVPPPPPRVYRTFAILAGPPRPAEGDGRLHRPQRRHRIPTRPPLSEAQRSPRHWPLHGRKPVAAPRPAVAWRGRSRAAGSPG